MALWSAGTVVAAVSPSYPVLLASRVLYAAGYAAQARSQSSTPLLMQPRSDALLTPSHVMQNPVSFGMIPELFPRRRASAMSAYNLAIHLGRAVSFTGSALAAPPAAAVAGAAAVAAVAAAGTAAAASSAGQAAAAAATAVMAVTPPEPALGGLITLPLDRFADVAALGGMTILYIAGDYLVLEPPGGADLGEGMQAAAAAALSAAGLTWRDVMTWIAAPGLLLVPALLLLVRDPGRDPQRGSRASRRRQRAGVRASRAAAARAAAKAAVAAGAPAREPRTGTVPVLVTARKTAVAAAAAAAAPPTEPAPSTLTALRAVFASPPWRMITAAAVLNDFGAWALIAFQATFYERTYGLEAGTYSAALALILPLSGVFGGVGGAFAIDRFSQGNPQARRYLLTGASLLAAPAFAASLLAPDWRLSLAALLPAAALAEVWRAPTAVIMRDSAPRGAPGAATAAHLACRNALAGLGPVAAAALAQRYDLRHALLLTPAAIALAGALFWRTETLLDARDADKQRKKTASREAAQSSA